jgi:hypothetical protein
MATMTTNWMDPLAAGGDAAPQAAPPLPNAQPELGGLTLGELAGNETAIRMLMNYYRRYVDENTAYRNEVNTLKTYVAAYESIKANSATGAVLLAVSNISVGFGVGLVAAQGGMAGWYSLILGVALMGAGLFFSFFKDR